MEPTSNIIRVLIVDDHPMVIAGIKTFLAEYPHVQVVGEAIHGKEAIEMTKSLHPDIVLMDISMPVMNGMDATRIIKRDFPKIHVIILTMHDDKEYIRQISQCGAKGYVLKNAPQYDILKAIEAVYRGNVFLSPEASKVILEMATTKEKSNQANESVELTGIETEVLIMLVQELNSKEIADKLCLSKRTVDNHRQHIMEKLHVHTAIGLAKYAFKKGLITM